MSETSSAEAVFCEALGKEPTERAAFLDRACAGNEPLRREVQSLLDAHQKVGQFLERPLVEAAGLADPAASAADSGDALPILAPSTEPGSLGRLDHYEVLEVVGKGGTGAVLRARDRKLERIVALKVLAAPLAVSGTARQRFAREARAAAAIRDEHVIAIHAVEDRGPVPYLVMEFIDGCTLEALLRRAGPLEVRDILRIGVQAASGLAAAHKQGLVHRDIKPANVLLENGVQRVKLTDFGLARAADDASLTQSGFIPGTPAYMSPEQANGEPIDHRSDLFSLGSVLYEMCTGRTAFRAPNTAAVLRRVSDETPRPIREVNPDVPEPLCRLIERLQAKKPADRPASAKEVADLLAGLLAELNGGRSGEPSGAPILQRPPQLPRPARRRWLWAAAAVVLLCAGLGLGEATGVTDVRGTVIRLFSPEGTLVVEVDDPGVSVIVDGGDVVITGAGAKEIRLKPGQYKVEANKDGTLIRRELVTVTRNGRQVVRISKESVDHVVNLRDPWEKSVAALRGEKQVEAVTQRLKERNPRFDGQVKPTIENGVVTGLEFQSDEVKDLSPVHVLDGLRLLDCGGSAPGKGKLEDLTPLRGLRLTSLNCRFTRVADLSPLQGMPLTSLSCHGTRVTDLAPLKGMRLRWLGLTDTAGVADLAPLRGMPLLGMDLYGLRRVKDIRPLEGMPLEYLNLGFLPVSDLSVLASMKSLRHLVLEGVPVRDLTPLRGLPVELLAIKGTRVTELTPLKGLPLFHLVLDYRPEDEEILRSMPALTEINNKPAAEFWKEIKGK
jgi:tRNA A-37 threonylcarbamoyl transferase component Bud32